MVNCRLRCEYHGVVITTQANWRKLSTFTPSISVPSVKKSLLIYYNFGSVADFFEADWSKPDLSQHSYATSLKNIFLLENFVGLSHNLYLSQKWYFRPVHRRTSSGHCKCSFFTTGNTKWIIILRNCTRKHVPHTTLAHTLRLQINRSESCSRPSTESWRSCLVLQGRWVENENLQPRNSRGFIVTMKRLHTRFSKSCWNRGGARYLSR